MQQSNSSLRSEDLKEHNISSYQYKQNLVLEMYGGYNFIKAHRNDHYAINYILYLII